MVFSVAGLQPPLPATFPWPYPDTESCSHPPTATTTRSPTRGARSALSLSPSLSALLRNALHRLLETLRNRSERRKRKTCAGLESNPRPLAHAPAPDAFAAARGARSTRSLAPSPLRSLISLSKQGNGNVRDFSFLGQPGPAWTEAPESGGDGGEDEGSVGEGGRTPWPWR